MRVEDPRDSNKRYFRSNKRVFVLNGSWFFSTREGEMGPFPTQRKAEEELERFKAEMSDLQRFQKKRESARDELRLQADMSRERTRLIRESRNLRPTQQTLREVLI